MDDVDLENPAALIGAGDDPSTLVAPEPDEQSTLRILVSPAVTLCVGIGFFYLLVRVSYNSGTTTMAAVGVRVLGVVGLIAGGLGCLTLFLTFLGGNQEGEEQLWLQQDRSR